MLDGEELEAEPRIYESGAVYAGRYLLGDHLGDGGMADVTRAFDRVTQRHVALKRLRARGLDRNTAFSIRLFEREFQVLSELAHPRVVEAYDYGIVDGLPHYSMELLEGGDLHDLAPMGVKQVCQVFRDVASVLALLHSRKLVYRDLNPRNIRCIAGGAAKLIDFGAMAVMGPTRNVIGTPGFVAPEVVHMQSLDGRADLYVLGCAMYFALTRRPPYMVRDFAQLKVAWTAQLPTASQYAPDVPKALDELLHDLLQLDPAFRPASAAEVMDRLSAIAALPDDDVLQVSGAYLVAPPLIDPQKTVQRVRGYLKKAQSGDGQSVVLAAPAGAGRTRMLEAVVLEAKLSGAVVVQADAGDARRGDYGVVERLANQLLEFVPEAMGIAELNVALLGHALGQVRERFPEAALQTFADPRDRRPAVQSALREWFVAVSDQQPYVVAVDDVDLIDEPSMTLIALLAAAIDKNSLCLLLTQIQDVDELAMPALKVLRDHARVLPLSVFSRKDTHALLSETFGDSNQLPLLTERLFDSSRGNARDLMQLAQYLVGNGTVRYEAGRWVLPQQLRECDLPSSAEEALSRVLDGLDEKSCELALLFAVSTRDGLSFEEGSSLLPGHGQRALLHAFSDLVVADVLQISGDVYRFSRSAWSRLLRDRASTQELAILHLRLADALEGEKGAEILRVHHLRHAGQVARALGEMVEFCAASVIETATDEQAFHRFIETLPSNWNELFNWALEEAERSGLSKRDAHMIRFRLSGCIGMSPDSNVAHQEALLSQLRHDVGLDIYATLEGEMLDPDERLKKTFELAQARYDAAGEEERVFSPLEALRPLAQALITAASLFVARFDYHLLRSLPSLKPVESLSPALSVVQLLMEGIAHRMTGRNVLSETAYAEIVSCLDRPDHSGLQPTHAKYARAGVVKGLGMLDVVIGRERTLQRVAALQGGALMQHGAGLIRMLHHYFQSEPKQGDLLRRQLALLKIESSAMQMLEGAHLPPEVIAHAAACDLSRLKEVLLEMEAYAERYPGWQPIIHYGRGELSRLRGDFRDAEAHFQQGMALCSAGEHQIWTNLAGARIAALVGLERPDEAVELAQKYRSEAEAAGQGQNVFFIRAPQVSALMHCGRVEDARVEADALIASMKELKVGGLLLGAAFEVSAQVAIVEGRREAASALINECAVTLRAQTNRLGHTRCDRLRRELNKASKEDMLSFELTTLQSEVRSRILGAMEGCEDVEQRQQCALEFILSQSGSASGALFLNQVQEFSLVAVVNVPTGIEQMVDLASRHFALLASPEESSEDDGMCTQTAMGDSPGGLEPGPKSDGGAGRCRAVLLGHREQGQYMLTGIAVVEFESDGHLPLSHVVPEMLSRFLVESGGSTLIATRL